jgi:YHS domain-containing protein
MPDINDLNSRIDAEIDAAKQKVANLQSQYVEQYQERRARLEQFEKLLEGLRDVWRPRLEALAEKFGKRVQVHPVVKPERREANFVFESNLAQIRLRFSVRPDTDVRNVVLSYDLDILPILMKYESHSELEQPLDAIDKSKLAGWIDDRIVGFVRTYLSLHENEYYLKDHMVEDPVAKVRFPKYAAGATLELKGKTIYFLSEETRQEFEQKQSKA